MNRPVLFDIEANPQLLHSNSSTEMQSSIAQDFHALCSMPNIRCISALLPPPSSPNVISEANYNHPEDPSPLNTFHVPTIHIESRQHPSYQYNELLSQLPKKPFEFTIPNSTRKQALVIDYNNNYINHNAEVFNQFETNQTQRSRGSKLNKAENENVPYAYTLKHYSSHVVGSKVLSVELRIPLRRKSREKVDCIMLKSHRKIHSAERAFKCRICGKEFREYRLYKAHRKGDKVCKRNRGKKKFITVKMNINI